MKKRSRTHEAGSVEAGSSIRKSIFLLIVSLGQSLRHSLAPKSSQPGTQERTGHPNRANQGAQVRAGQPNRSNQGTQERIGQANRNSQGAQDTQIEPPRAPRSAQSSQIEAAKALRSAQSTQIEATRATSTKHCPCAAKSTFRCTGPRFSSSQIEQAMRPGAHRAAKSSQPGRPG